MYLAAMTNEELISYLRVKTYNVNHTTQRRGEVGRLTVEDVVSKAKLQNLKCAKCLVDLTKDLNDHSSIAVIDHILPMAKGGKNTIDNIQFLCSKCNNAKGVKYVNYLDWTEDRILEGEAENQRIKVSDSTRKKLSFVAKNVKDKHPRFNSLTGVNGVSRGHTPGTWDLHITLSQIAWYIGAFSTVEEAKEVKNKLITVTLIGPLPEEGDTEKNHTYYSVISKRVKELLKEKGFYVALTHPKLGFGSKRQPYMVSTQTTFRAWVLDRLNINLYDADIVIFLPGWEECEHASSLRRRANFYHLPILDLPNRLFTPTDVEPLLAIMRDLL